MTFSKWLRGSNEAKPFRDAFELNDKMPLDFGLKARCFGQIERAAKEVWQQTKRDLRL